MNFVWKEWESLSGNLQSCLVFLCPLLPAFVHKLNKSLNEDAVLISYLHVCFAPPMNNFQY